jgi:hypothetical protein
VSSRRTRITSSIAALCAGVALAVGVSACGGGGSPQANTAGAPTLTVPTNSAPPSDDLDHDRHEHHDDEHDQHRHAVGLVGHRQHGKPLLGQPRPEPPLPADGGSGGAGVPGTDTDPRRPPPPPGGTGGPARHLRRQRRRRPVVVGTSAAPAGA